MSQKIRVRARTRRCVARGASNFHTHAQEPFNFVDLANFATLLDVAVAGTERVEASARQSAAADAIQVSAARNPGRNKRS